MEQTDVFLVFAKVGELGSLSAAARALGLPKVRVSRAVSGLEARYDVKLIERSTRRVVLTEAGRLLHARCLRMREEQEEARAELATYRGDPSGTLRIGCSGDVARSLITPNIHEFLDQYPEIDVRILVGERLIPEPNGLDVVLHAGWLSDSRLTMRKITEIMTLLVASKTYVELHGRPESPSDLAGHAIVGNFYLDPVVVEPGRLPAYVPPLEVVGDGKRHRLPIWKRFASTDRSQVQELVERGRAIAPISVVAGASGLLSGQLVHVMPRFEIYNQPTLYALYTERAAMVPKLKIFLDFVAELVRRRADTLRQQFAQA